MGARAPDRRAYRFGLVAARSVHDGDVAAAGSRDQLRFDIGPEGVAVGRAVQDPGSVDPVMAQGADEVEVLQRPGAFPGSLSPLGAHPRSGAMPVLTQVSSMKTGLRGSARP